MSAMDGGDDGNNDDDGGEDDTIKAGDDGEISGIGDCATMMFSTFDESANQSAIDSTERAAQNKARVSLASFCFHHDNGGSGGSSGVPTISSSS